MRSTLMAYQIKPRSKPRRFALQSARGTLQHAIRKAKSEWIIKQLGRVNDGIFSVEPRALKLHGLLSRP